LKIIAAEAAPTCRAELAPLRLSRDLAGNQPNKLGYKEARRN